MNSDWSWADLDDEQLRILQEAETTLGTDILLAYDQGGQASIQGERVSQSGLEVAPINESQLECLQGLETKMQSVVIAYQKTNS